MLAKQILDYIGDDKFVYITCPESKVSRNRLIIRTDDLKKLFSVEEPFVKERFTFEDQFEDKTTKYLIFYDNDHNVSITFMKSRPIMNHPFTKEKLSLIVNPTGNAYINAL